MRQSVEAWFVGLVTGYECTALVAHSDRLPTITALVARLPTFARRVIGCAAGVWLYVHFNPAEHR